MRIFLQSPFWDTIYNTFVNIFTSIGYAFSNNVVISILTFAILLILIIYRVIRNRYTTELVTYRAISRINEYLSKNPFITEENLVEFNRLMMQCPKTIRFQWQRYIINRDKKPSDFLNEENCITRPLRTNSYKQGLKSFMLGSIVLCVISACFIIGTAIDIQAQFGLVLRGLIAPSLALFVSLIFMLFGNVLYNAIMNDLYFSYANFEKAIDRAVLNMPEAIDYEIIFTPKEIQNGIPALQEFLEQRALYEQEQIQKAKESEVEHETYNFSALGVNGSLVMERALAESEQYLGNRRRLLAEIETIQTEKRSIEKDFDDKNKDYQRNLRDIREEISSLKSKIEVVTNEITRSSLRRQQAAEVEKEQNIEQEIEKETKKFNAKISKLDAEIDAKKFEIEQSKVNAEQSLTEEFKHFSEKTYKDLKKVAKEEVQEKVDALILEKNELEVLLEEKDKLMAEKLSLYEDKSANFDALELEVKESKDINNELKNEISGLNDEIEAKNQEIFEIKQELESRKRELLKKDEMIDNFKKKKAVEVYRYFDANGNEFYFDDNENPYYLDADGNAVYYDGENQENEITDENTLMETSEEFAEENSLNEDISENLENNEVFEIESTEENLVDEKETSEESQSIKTEEKPKKKKGRKTKKVHSVEEDSSVETESSQEYQENIDDENDIKKTLNKLAKAAEEKIKEAKTEKTTKKSTTKKSASKKSSSKKSTKKKNN